MSMFSYLKCFLKKFQCVGLFVFSTGSVMDRCCIFLFLVFSVPEKKDHKTWEYKIQLASFCSGSWRICFLPEFMPLWLPRSVSCKRAARPHVYSTEMKGLFELKIFA